MKNMPSILKRKVMPLFLACLFLFCCLPLAGRAQAFSSDDVVFTAPYTTVSEVKTEADFAKGEGDYAVDILVMHLDGSGNVMDGDGTVLGAFSSYANSIESICAFYVSDGEAATAAISIMKQKPYCYVVSDDVTLVGQVRSAVPLSQGMIDFRGKGLTAVAMRDAANRANAKSVLLTLEEASAETVGVLRKLLMNAIVEISGEAEFYRAVTHGAQGLFSEANEVWDYLESGNEHTLAAPPLLSAHRGLPGDTKESGKLYPENTLAAAKAACYDYGADFIEIDLRLTVDKRIAIMHDAELTRTTTGTGNIESYTSSQLERFKVHGGYSDVDLEDIPFLEDYFEEFKDKDVYFLLEIKSTTPEIVTYIKEVIDRYEMSARVNFISFNKEQLAVVREKMPQISVSLLQSDKDPSLPQYVNAVLNALLPINAGYSPSYNTVSKGTAEKLARYGVSVWTWTYLSFSDLKTDIRATGYTGYTTNFVSYAYDCARTVTPATLTLPVSEGKAREVEAEITRFSGEKGKDNVQLVKIGGDGVLKRTTAGKYYLESGESVEVVLRYPDEVMGYYLLSEPVTFTAEKEEPPKENKGCSGTVTGSLLPCGMAILFVCAVLCLRKKN